MFYCIDHDTSQVESKSETRDLLDKYLEDLSPGFVVIVESADELCLEFSFDRLKLLAQNVGVERIPEAEDELADRIWDALEANANQYPKFTAALGKKLLSGSEPKDKPASGAKPAKTKAAPKTSSGGSRAKLDLDTPLFVVDGKCKSGSILATIVSAIDDELCGTVGEVVDHITANHVIPKTGELADEKFAHHNIKYFLKQGKLSNEEEL